MVAAKPRIHDCYGILEGGASIWRVLGIFPLTIEGPMGSKKYEINKFYVVYSCFIFFGCNINIINIALTWSAGEKNLVIVILLLRSVSSVLSLFVAIIWRIFRHNELSRLIGTLAAQESMLQKMNCRQNYESNAKAVRAYVWTTMMTAAFLVAYNHFISGEPLSRFAILMNLVENRIRRLRREGIQWIFWCVPVVIQTVDLTIFASLVGLLGLQFRALNERLKAVAIRANASSPKVIVTSDMCADNLRIIAKTHYNICAVGKRINSFFNWNVIINVITAFLILSTTLYNIFVEVQREGNINYLRIGVHVQWELIHSVPIIGVVMICNWTSHRAFRAGKMIHEIRVIETDSRLYESVKSFSLQLHHQKLEFNAGGFFPLNSTLLQTIVGNITTYLVLLIQFQPKVN